MNVISPQTGINFDKESCMSDSGYGSLEEIILDTDEVLHNVQKPNGLGSIGPEDKALGLSVAKKCGPLATDHSAAHLGSLLVTTNKNTNGNSTNPLLPHLHSQIELGQVVRHTQFSTCKGLGLNQMALLGERELLQQQEDNLIESTNPEEGLTSLQGKDAVAKVWKLSKELRVVGPKIDEEYVDLIQQMEDKDLAEKEQKSLKSLGIGLALRWLESNLVDFEECGHNSYSVDPREY
ncbi:hypothetical protein E2542_SST20525 [Spatholobus suberectus]|nr:hypothetical protein E2542_SST20525 [Spatholobus suberectus]